MSRTTNHCLTTYRRRHVEKEVVDKERIDYCLRPLRKFLGRRTAEKLSIMDCRYYRRRRQAQGVSDATIRRELSCLSAALRFCYHEQVIGQLPELELPPSPPPKDRFLTREQADQLIAAAGPRARLFIQIALGTGGRPEAIDGLTWPQVDLDRRFIDFNGPDRAQTDKRRPKVPIADWLYPILAEEQRRAKTIYVLGNSSSTYTTFTTARRNAGMSWCTRKTLRHTWATWAAQAGVSIWKIAGVLGDKVETVERVYAHQHPDYLRDAVNF